MNRKLLNITLEHAFFSNSRELQVSMSMPAHSRRVATNYGLVVKFRANQIQLYTVDGFDPEAISSAGPLWIYVDFLSERISNVTDADLTPDKHVLYFACSEEQVQTDEPIFQMELLSTLNNLIDKCDDFGIEACETDQLILPDGSVWSDSLAEYISKAESSGIDEGLIELNGGMAEGVYLNISHERWTNPHAVLQITPESLYEAASHQEPTDIRLSIPNRSVYWCYYLIKQGHPGLDASQLRVISTEPNGGTGDSLPEFTHLDTIDFSGQEKAARFCSIRPVGLLNRYPFTIELKGYSNSEKPVILPYPEVNVLSSIERSGKVELSSNIYLYL